MKTDKSYKINNGGFKVPDDYFENFEQDLMDTIHLKSNVPESGFKVPMNYFESLDERIMDSIESTSSSKVIRLQPWKSVVTIAAVAATILLMLGFFINSNDPLDFEKLETASIESYISEEDYSEYELAALLQIEALTNDNFVNTQISEEKLEDYLLENTDLESLFIE